MKSLILVLVFFFSALSVVVNVDCKFYEGTDLPEDFAPVDLAKDQGSLSKDIAAVQDELLANLRANQPDGAKSQFKISHIPLRAAVKFPGEDVVGVGRSHFAALDVIQVQPDKSQSRLECQIITGFYIAPPFKAHLESNDCLKRLD